MSLSLKMLWREERAAGLRRLSGTRVSGVVPIRDALIERALSMRRLPGAVESLRIRLHEGNHLSVVADVRVLGFRKRLEALLRVAPAIDAHPPRRLHVFFAERSLLSSAMGLAGPFLPGWVSRSDNGLVLDLDRLGAAVGIEDLLPHLTAAAFEGHEGVLWVNFELEIAADGQAAGALAPMSGAGVPAAAGLPVTELAPLMAGAQLAIRARVAESLVNELLGAVTAATTAGRAGDGWRPMVELTSTPRVTFEAGAMVVEATLRSPARGTAA
jgi:hypothetical protein